MGSKDAFKDCTVVVVTGIVPNDHYFFNGWVPDVLEALRYFSMMFQSGWYDADPPYSSTTSERKIRLGDDNTSKSSSTSAVRV